MISKITSRITLLAYLVVSILCTGYLWFAHGVDLAILSGVTFLMWERYDKMAKLIKKG